MSLQVFHLDQATDLDRLDWFASLRQTAWGSSDAAAAVAQIIADIMTRGDEAVAGYMQKWTDPGFTVHDIRVPPEPITQALEALDGGLRRAFQTAIDHVRAYQQHILPAAPKPITIDGAELGLRFTPVQRVGLVVPGGKAAYPSTVLMLAVPAMVAGVAPENITVVTPPPTQAPTHDPASGSRGQRGDVSPLVLAVCAMLGIQRVYRIGGAQAVAAMALGTQTIEPVDLIAGPGNIYTQLAKQQLNGRVGIDGFYGPSEILTIADASADATRVASDLIAQAEHDPGRCFLVAWSPQVIERINQQVEQQLASRQRKMAIIDALQSGSAAVLVPDESTAVQVADRIAAEHVSLAVSDPKRWLDRLGHGGEFFLSDNSPVAAGDYIAGPSHCLPTGTTARFTSGVSVYTFLKRSGTVYYRDGVPAATIDATAQLAQVEGLDAHAQSMRTRDTR